MVVSTFRAAVGGGRLHSEGPTLFPHKARTDGTARRELVPRARAVDCLGTEHVTFIFAQGSGVPHVRTAFGILDEANVASQKRLALIPAVARLLLDWLAAVVRVSRSLRIQGDKGE